MLYAFKQTRNICILLMAGLAKILLKVRRNIFYVSLNLQLILFRFLAKILPLAAEVRLRNSLNFQTLCIV